MYQSSPSMYQNSLLVLKNGLLTRLAACPKYFKDLKIFLKILNIKETDS